MERWCDSRYIERNAGTEKCVCKRERKKWPYKHPNCLVYVAVSELCYAHWQWWCYIFDIKLSYSLFSYIVLFLFVFIFYLTEYYWKISYNDCNDNNWKRKIFFSFVRKINHRWFIWESQWRRRRWPLYDGLLLSLCLDWFTSLPSPSPPFALWYEIVAIVNVSSSSQWVDQVASSTNRNESSTITLAILRRPLLLLLQLIIHW